MGRKRSYISGLSRLLAAYPEPVYALDADRIVTYCNAACLEWAGAAVDEIVGRRCDYHSGHRADGSVDRLGGLCPPPDVFNGRPLTAEIAYPDTRGRWVSRPAECLPLADATGNCQGVLVVVYADDLARQTPRLDIHPSPVELHQQLRRLMQEQATLRGTDTIVGQSTAIARVRRQVELAVASDARVVVSGPPGSGRETIARAIHYGGSAAASPLTPLACQLLDSELLESTITAFVASCAELETEGPAALLLLEVDQLERDAQAALAGILSIGELNVRTLATTRTPLIELAEQGGYRGDLALALSTLVIQVPPLSDRPEDIPLLAQFFLEEHNAAGGKQLAGFLPDTLDQLTAYTWPENGDELCELVQQACAAAPGPWIAVKDLPDQIRLAAEAEAHPTPPDVSIVLDDFLADVERELLARAMQSAKGNKAQAARLLGVSRARLLRRLDHFGL
jgi:DNA-binding NtrC family response regulator